MVYKTLKVITQPLSSPVIGEVPMQSKGDGGAKTKKIAGYCGAWEFVTLPRTFRQEKVTTLTVPSEAARVSKPQPCL